MQCVFCYKRLDVDQNTALAKVVLDEFSRSVAGAIKKATIGAGAQSRYNDVYKEQQAPYLAVALWNWVMHAA